MMNYTEYQDRVIVELEKSRFPEMVNMLIYDGDCTPEDVAFTISLVTYKGYSGNLSAEELAMIVKEELAAIVLDKSVGVTKH